MHSIKIGECANIVLFKVCTLTLVVQQQDLVLLLMQTYLLKDWMTHCIDHEQEEAEGEQLKYATLLLCLYVGKHGE